MRQHLIILGPSLRPRPVFSYVYGSQRRNSTLDIKLRQYQVECIESVLSYLKGGFKRLGISLATGSGKTVVFSHLINQIPVNKLTGGSQCLILVHRRELVEQATRHCALSNPGKTIEVEMGKSRASGVADITVASIQSLIARERLKKFSPERFKLVLVDEAHHIVANSYRTVLKHMGLWHDDDHTNAPALIGVSATFARFDGLRLGAAVDHIVYHKDFIDMIREGWLSDVIFTTVKSHVDLSEIKADAAGDYSLSSLSKVCNTEEANDITVRTWLAKAQTRKSTLIFCVDTAHVRSLRDLFRRYGIDARGVLGTDRNDERARNLEDFKEGRFPVMLNCGVFTEGTDIPNIDCVLLARPTRSRNLLIQMIGRGMRQHPGKTNCHIIDLVASLNAGLVTTPTLFGLDPDELVDHASVEALEANRVIAANNNSSSSHPKLGGSAISKVTFTEYDSVQDFLKDGREDQHIRKLSQNAWVSVGEDRYVLVNHQGDFVTVEPNESVAPNPSFRVRFNERVPSINSRNSWLPIKRAQQIAQAEDLESAVHAADTFVASRTTFARYTISFTAKWRASDCTNEQLSFLNKTIGKTNPFTKDDLSKGQAADMITKIKFGGRGRYEKAMATMKRARRLERRTIDLRKREHVSVGPL